MKFFRFNFLDLRLSRKANGFTLTELMVVIGIMTIMNLLIFSSYPEFSQRLALKRTSEDIALIVRQAQAYSLGIKKSGSVDIDYTGFGVHFDKTTKDKQKSLILFADSSSGNLYKYDEGELFQEYKINTGDVVFDLQVCKADGCVVLDTVDTVNTVDIFYPRSRSMAIISGEGIIDANASYAKVVIRSPKGKMRTIKIWISGEISVKEDNVQ